MKTATKILKKNTIKIYHTKEANNFVLDLLSFDFNRLMVFFLLKLVVVALFAEWFNQDEYKIIADKKLYSTTSGKERWRLNSTVKNIELLIWTSKLSLCCRYIFIFSGKKITNKKASFILKEVRPEA